MTMKKTNDNNNNTTETNSSQSSSKLQLFTYMDSLYLLTDLFNYGLITQEEYERKREKISNEMYATSSSSNSSSSSDDSIPQQPSHDDDDADEWDDDKKQEISDRVAKLCESSQMKVLDFLLEQVPDKLERRNNQAHLDLSEMNDEMCSRLMQLIVNLEERDNRYSPIQPDIIVHVPAVNHFLNNTTISNNTNNNTNNNSTDSTNNNNSPDRKRQRSNSYSEESPENIDHDERDRKRVKRSPYTKAFYEQLFSNNLYNYYTKSPM